MWEVFNGTPFATGAYFVRDREGLEHWVVAVRARFGLGGGLPRVVEQAPVRMSPEYADADAQELAAEADLAPFRPHTDILLRGHAFPPEDGGRDRLLTLKVGTLEKRVRAFGPRHVKRRGRGWLVERQSFAPFALSWRRSLGGRDVLAGEQEAGQDHPANPLGTGWSPGLAKAPEGTAFFLPQVERPDELMHPDRPLPQPVGFGAIQPGWQPRAGRAGTYDDAWRDDRAPLPPNDFSEVFHQASPDDQVYRPGVQGGEPVELEGFSTGGPIRFQLPQVLLNARTRIGVETVDTRFRVVGVEIDASAGLLDMIWNVAVPCPGGDHLVRHSHVMLQQMAGVAR